MARLGSGKSRAPGPAAVQIRAGLRRTKPGATPHYIRQACVATRGLCLAQLPHDVGATLPRARSESAH